MDQQPLVSIIIPVQNLEWTIDSLLDDLAKQSYQNIEVLIVENGSTDQTSEWVRRRMVIDSRFHLIIAEKTGVSHARNLGLAHAKGSLVGFVDGDDRIQKNYVLDLITPLIRDHEMDVSICRHSEDGVRPAIPLFDKTQILNNSTADYLKILKQSSPSVWAKLFKKDVLSSLVFDDELSIGEDNLFLIKALCLCKGVCFVNSVNYWYVQHEKSALKEISTAKIQSQFEFFRKIHQFYSEKNMWSIVRKYWSRRAKTNCFERCVLISSPAVFLLWKAEMDRLFVNGYFSTSLGNRLLRLFLRLSPIGLVKTYILLRKGLFLCVKKSLVLLKFVSIKY